MRYIGKILFFVLWPLVWLYAPLTRRARAVIIREGNILLVKNWFGPGLWQLPGGGIKFSEQPSAAIKREVAEELGCTVKAVHPLHEEVLILRQLGLLMRYHFLKVELDNSKNIVQNNREIVETTWMSVDKLDNVSKEVQYALKLL